MKLGVLSDFRHRTATVLGSLLLAFLPVVGCGFLASRQLDADTRSVTNGAGAYALPMTIVKLDVLGAEQVCEVAISEDKGIVLVPDRRLIFSTKYLASPLAHDTLRITTTKEGFIESVTGSADDKTGPILRTIASTVLTLMTGVPVGVGAERAAPPKLATLLIDPNSQESLGLANEYLRPVCGLTVTVDALGRHISDPNGAGGSGGTDDSQGGSDIYAGVDLGPCERGVCYRLPLPYRLDVTKDTRSVRSAGGSFLVYSLNASPIIAADVRRTMFVDRDTTLTFSQGVLTDSKVEKPSEALEVVRIPLDIANALVALPAQLIQLRIDQTTDQKGLIEANTNLQNALATAIDARRALLEKLPEGSEVPGTGEHPLDDVLERSDRVQPALDPADEQ